MGDPIAPISETAPIQPVQLDPIKQQAIHDSIGPAKPSTTTYTPSKPILPPPGKKSDQRNCFYRMVGFVNYVHDLEIEMMKLATEEQEDLVKELSKIAKEELEKAHQAEKAGEAASSWSYLNKFATCLFAAATMSIGFYLTGNPDITGWVSYGLIASGAGSIASMALAEMDVLPNVMRMVGLGSSMLGLVLGGGSSFAHIASHLPDLLTQTTVLGINCLYGMSTVGRGYCDSQRTWFQHEQLKARQARRQIEGKAQESCQNAEFMVERLEHINKRALAMLKDQKKQQDQMQRIATQAA